MKIKTKILLTTSIAFAVSLILVVLVNGYLFNDLTQKRLQQREFPAQLGMLAEGVSRNLAEPLAVTDILSITPQVVHFLEDGEPSDSLPVLKEYLLSVKQRHQAIATFVISTETGSYYTEAGLNRVIRKNDGRNDWFFQFLDTGLPYELTLDVDDVTGVPSLFINHLVNDAKGNVIGVTGIGLSLAGVSEMIKGFKVGEAGQVLMVDSQGIIKLHGDNQWIGKPLTEFRQLDPSALLTPHGEQLVKASSGSETSLMLAKLVPSLGWYLVVDMPESEVYRGIEKAQLSSISVGAGLALAFILFTTLLITKLFAPIDRVAEKLEEIAAGGADLTQRLDVANDDELGRLAQGYNQFVEALAQMLLQVKLRSEELHELVAVLTQELNDIRHHITNQQRQTDQVASAMEEMGATVAEIAENAGGAADSAREADDGLQEGNQQLQSTLSQVSLIESQSHSTEESVQELADKARSIDTVLEVISGVAEQTNLLALNASIEAARAGEHGRGFAVVADEVRALANRSHESTEQIRAIIEELQTTAQRVAGEMNTNVSLSVEGKSSATESSEKLSGISVAVAKMNDINTQIAAVTQQQSVAVNEMNRLVTDIAIGAQKSLDNTELASERCNSLNEQAEVMHTLVNRFKLS
ncbi:methyl-accepting chemotaxis protein [Ferrimonas aestuarii]|uniref:Methyl-accepting chemotaxis protein n=1 Tax=Ferrimonas aestuarii TaxID=2569539 RepID=A0A4U1BK68_9GAMM|nr:methyl-accepting chemotaxis protein [Ferrimonas aestuarii]TKB51851.1 methyl-accepting chemotaxis protein [Ferrimonas aestuarii]